MRFTHGDLLVHANRRAERLRPPRPVHAEWWNGSMDLTAISSLRGTPLACLGRGYDEPHPRHLELFNGSRGMSAACTRPEAPGQLSGGNHLLYLMR